MFNGFWTSGANVCYISNTVSISLLHRLSNAIVDKQGIFKAALDKRVIDLKLVTNYRCAVKIQAKYMTHTVYVLNYVIPSQISFAFNKASKLAKLRLAAILFELNSICLRYRWRIAVIFAKITLD